jgi:hypothetical protein
MEEPKMNNQDAKRVITGKVRVSYCNLTTPRAPQQGGAAKYSATLLIPKSDFATKQRIDAAIQAAILEGTAAKWNGQRPIQPATPLYDGDGLRASGEAFTPECKGHWVMTASSEQKPEVVDFSLNPIIDATQIYSGMYAHVSIRFFAYFNSGKKGIGCGLGNVQKIEDGEPLSGRTSASDDFSTEQSPWPVPQQPQYQPQPQAPNQPQYQPQYQTQPQFDPITGKPIVGNIMGL